VADDLAPREAHFAHADPGSPATGEYPRVLRAPVLFSQPDRALVFDARQLDVPLVEADPILGGILDAHLRRALEALPPVPDASFCSRVRRVLAETLSSGEPAAHVVAGRLGVGVRTLNRRLTAEGASLRGLRDTLRRELAESHLTERRLPIPQVAFLLGFSEASAFHRWFRRVSGTTPSAFRRARTLRASRASPASELPSS
jgi:AraC-like DNA-binding protein